MTLWLSKPFQNESFAEKLQASFSFAYQQFLIDEAKI